MGERTWLAERWPLDATTWVEVAVEAAAGGGLRLLDDFRGLVHQFTRGGAPCAG